MVDATQPGPDEALELKTARGRRANEQSLDMPLGVKLETADDDVERSPALRLLPIAGTNARVVRAHDALRHDPFEIERVSFREHLCAVADDVIGEPNARISVPDGVTQNGLAIEQGSARQVFAVEPQQIEDLKDHATLGASAHVALQLLEIGEPGLIDVNDLTIEPCARDAQAARMASTSRGSL